MRTIKKMTAKEAERIKQDFIKEFNRLLTTGALSDDTTRQTLIKVTLANMADSYRLVPGDYQNLRKF